jgi:hypothetical protein
VTNVQKAGGPDQPGGDKEDHAGQRGRDHHAITVSRSGGSVSSGRTPERKNL